MEFRLLFCNRSKISINNVYIVFGKVDPPLAVEHLFVWCALYNILTKYHMLFHLFKKLSLSIFLGTLEKYVIQNCTQEVTPPGSCLLHFYVHLSFYICTPLLLSRKITLVSMLFGAFSGNHEVTASTEGALVFLLMQYSTYPCKLFIFYT